MAKKIKLENKQFFDIVKLMEENHAFKQYKLCVKSGDNSCRTENNIATAIELFFPLYVLVAYEYYKLKSNHDHLNKEAKNALVSLNEVLLLFFRDNNPSKELMEIVQSFHNKFYDINIDKAGFISKNCVIFDDNSPEHKGAFKENNQYKYPDKNILLKFTYKDTHLRMGISLDIDNKVMIIKIGHKKQISK